MYKLILKIIWLYQNTYMSCVTVTKQPCQVPTNFIDRFIYSTLTPVYRLSLIR